MCSACGVLNADRRAKLAAEMEAPGRTFPKALAGAAVLAHPIPKAQMLVPRSTLAAEVEAPGGHVSQGAGGRGGAGKTYP